ncbi:MAG: transposase, partial [Thermoplasmataceae archaeon]
MRLTSSYHDRDTHSELLTEFKPLFDRRQFRQFSRYIASSWSSPTRSVAHLNGIFVEHTNQSNLNRFLRNIPALDIFRKSCDLINRYSSDPVMVIDDTILPRNG